MKQRFLLALLFIPMLCVAGDATTALEAFHAGNYALAAELYEQAISAGDNTRATRYNLAVSYFKLNEIQAASRNFRILADEGFATPEVVYSLAVTEKLQGETESAANLFAQVANGGSVFAENAQEQLALLGVDVTSSNSQQRAFATTLAISAGYNDSIADIKDGKLIRGGDSFAETSGSLNWHGISGFDASVSFYNNSYADTEDQNISQLTAGVSKSRQVKALTFTLSTEADISTLDNQGFLNSLNVGLALGSANTKYSWRTGYQFKHSNSLNTKFAPYAGDHHRLTADLGFKASSSQQFGLHVSYEDMDLATFTSSQYSLDLSRIQQRVGLSWAWQLTGRTQLSSMLSYGEQEVPDYQLQAVSSLKLDRHETLWGYATALQYAATPALSWGIAFRTNDNQSNLADFDFNQSIFEIGFNWRPKLGQ